MTLLQIQQTTSKFKNNKSQKRDVASSSTEKRIISSRKIEPPEPADIESAFSERIHFNIKQNTDTDPDPSAYHKHH